MTLDALLDRLKTLGGPVHRSGSQWVARCPAHEDRTPSLAIADKDGRLLVRCHAGCTAEAVVGALGLTMADLFTDPNPRVRSFRLPLPDGRVVIHERVDGPAIPGGKTFAWIGPDGTPGIADKGIHGPDLPLYNATAVAAALVEKPGRTVVLVEGEAKVDALTSAGVLAAGTVTGASGTPSRASLEVLRGARVLLWPDNDDVGRAHMLRVAQLLAGIAKVVKWISIEGAQPHDDAADLVALNEPAQVNRLIIASIGDVPQGPTSGRRLRLTSLDGVRVRPVRWLWEGRLALGTLALLGGREGIGKSIVWIDRAALLTLGRLPGVFYGVPKSIVVAATEDSFEFTIVPRLMAAGADLSRVYRVDVTDAANVDTGLSLPRDLPALGELVAEVDAALVVLDPMLSRLDAALDTHKDAEVRRALEPLVALAGRYDVVVLGLIHVNKAITTDPLTALMASRAFPAVARSVLFLMRDPGDEGLLLLGQPKNNLGITFGPPTLTLRIGAVHVADTEEGPVWAPRAEWVGETTLTISEAMDDSMDAERAANTQDAATWLHDFLESHGNGEDSIRVKEAAKAAGYSGGVLHRARHRLHVVTSGSGYPRRTMWTLPVVPLSHSTYGESDTTGTTGTTEVSHSSRSSHSSRTSAPARAVRLGISPTIRPDQALEAARMVFGADLVDPKPQ
jgi:hypothetical protein